MTTIRIDDLIEQLDRVGILPCCELTALDREATDLPPYGIVRLAWDSGDTDYYLAGTLALALAGFADDAGLEEAVAGLPSEVEPEIREAIDEVGRREEDLERARRDLDRARWAWHARQPVCFAEFRPAHYSRGGNVDYCYGERGEVVECRDGRIIKDEGRCYAVAPSPHVDRINAEIATMLAGA